MSEWKPITPNPQPQILQQQKEILNALKTLIEAQISKDQAKLAEMLEVLERTKHGGGG